MVILSQESKGGASGQFGGSSANQMIGSPKKMDPLERITWSMITAVFVLVIFTNFFVGGATQIESNNIKEAQKKKSAPPQQPKPTEKKPTENK